MTEKQNEDESIMGKMERWRKLPSIFVTCPELQKFSSILPIFLKQNSSGSSDPEPQTPPADFSISNMETTDPYISPYVFWWAQFWVHYE